MDDRLAGLQSEVHGSGSITRSSATRLLWHERGVWVRDGRRSPVERAHLIDAEESGWVVRFDDGRPFHPWVTEDDVVHPCGEDTYTGRYDLTDLPWRWRSRWHCTGPAKDYVLSTAWTREPRPRGDRTPVEPGDLLVPSEPAGG